MAILDFTGCAALIVMYGMGLFFHLPYLQIGWAFFPSVWYLQVLQIKPVLMFGGVLKLHLQI